MHEAIAQGRADWVEALIEKGADVTSAGRQGQTPLFASLKGFEDPLRTFSQTSDPEYTAEHIKRVPAPLLPNTPFITEQAEILARQINDNLELRIELAIALGHSRKDVESYRRIVRLLLEVGADPNQSSEQQPLSPFLYATEIGDPWVLNILLENGADIRTRDEYGAAAYTRLNRFGHQKTASDLLLQVCPEDRLWLRDH